ncbi:MAG TPA: histidine kinase [Flavisolibacter sp.]|nr:histidine kinase [Flavisolibacter sp.]
MICINKTGFAFANTVDYSICKTYLPLVYLRKSLSKGASYICHMPLKLNRYWTFQIVGWGLFGLINVFFAFIFGQFKASMLCRLLFFLEIGIISSHYMRQVIRKNSLLLRPINQQIILLLILTLTFASFFSLVQTPFEAYYNFYPTGKPAPFHVHFFYNLSSSFVLLFIWNSIYFMYHYVAKSRKQQLDTLQLEALVKSLELKTIKAHINPHFIFNALNSIRALIDENPARARRAITELSNILRSSLQAEKGETVSLEEELKIVKDYLALENMRFEDRLKVEYEIDEDTLGQQVPPMMLQTLVENAIKHGISKQVKGGVVKIISDFRENYHELAVQNTGHLNGASSRGGFGISSTQDRLGLLYGDKAQFQIAQVNPELVEAKVLIPA